MTDSVPSKDVNGPPFTVDRYGSFAEAVIAHRDWLSKEIDRLQSLLSAAYQLAGLVGAPVRFLDAFSRHDGSGDDLLPVTLEECDEIERLRTALRGIQSCSSCSACRGAATMALGGSAPEPADAPRRMRIAFQPQGRCLWHEDCSVSSSGVMREVQHEESRSLLECLNCGQRGYYPKGAVGSVCVDVVGYSSQPEVVDNQEIFSVTTGKVERYEQPPKDPIRALVESAYKDGYGGDLTDDRDLSARTLEMMRRMADEPAGDSIVALDSALAEINDMIVPGHLRGDGTDQTAQRNGIILAANKLQEIIDRATPPPGDDPADVIMSRGDGG